MLSTGTTTSDRGRYTVYGTRFTVDGLRYTVYGPPCAVYRVPSTVYRQPYTGLHQPEHFRILQHFAWVADLEFAGHHGHHRVEVAGK